MSEFATAMASAWTAAVAVFGDVIVFAGSATEYPCVIHELNYTTEVDNNQPGRREILSGTVVMKGADWILSAGEKGSKITVGGANGRILNDPNVGFTGDTVTLVIGPRT